MAMATAATVVSFSPHNTHDSISGFLSRMSSSFLSTSVQSKPRKVDLDIRLQNQPESSSSTIARQPADCISGTLVVTIAPPSRPSTPDPSGSRSIGSNYDDVQIDKVLVGLEGGFESTIPFADESGDPLGPGFAQKDRVFIKFLDQLHAIEPSSYTVIGTGIGPGSPSQLEYHFFFKMPTDTEKFDPRVVAVPSLFRTAVDGSNVATLPPSLSIPYLDIRYKLKVTLQYHIKGAPANSKPTTKRVERNLKFVPFGIVAAPIHVEDYPEELQLSDQCPVEASTTFGSNKRIGNIGIEVFDQPRHINIRRSSPITLSGPRTAHQKELDSRGGSSLSVNVHFTPAMDFTADDVDTLLSTSHIEMREYLYTQTFNSTRPMDKAPTVAAARESQARAMKNDGTSVRGGPRIRYTGREELLHTFEVDTRSWNKTDEAPSPPFTSEPGEKELVLVNSNSSGKRKSLPPPKTSITRIKLPIPVDTGKLVPSFRAQLAETRYVVELRLKIKMGKDKYQSSRTLKVRAPLRVINAPVDAKELMSSGSRRASATGDELEFEEIGEFPPEYMNEHEL